MHGLFYTRIKNQSAKNLKIMMQPKKLETTISKDILVLAGVATVLFIIFNVLALSEFQESLQ